VAIRAAFMCGIYQIDANDDDSCRFVAAGFWRCLRAQLFRSWVSDLRRHYEWYRSLDVVLHFT
jgi:hypothetical protein